MSAIFLPEDVSQLLKGKTVVYIGDSVQRSMYKDLVLLFQDKRYLTDQELRAKGELCFLGDELMEGGKKGEMSNSTKYREVRKYLHDSQTKVLYFFITACFGEYIEMLLKKLRKPDIIFMNSCLWDVHRYGTKGYEGYGPNLVKLVKLIKELHPSILFAWTTTPPVDIRSKAGFLEDRKDFVKINEVLRCNDIARGIMRKEGIPIADFADVFRHFTHHRANDGVHWNEKAHRRMTNILLETVARHLKKPIPRPISDDFGRMGDFADRPPFPHSFSQPAFHHNNSWGSFDEERWHWDSYSYEYYPDDFSLGLDRSYGGGNYSYFESDDDMSPRFMPPPGRRMPLDGHGPPPMRPPPPPPGYRFGTNDPVQMREGRRRKVRDEEIETMNKRPRLEKTRKLSTGSERGMSSPLVENRPLMRDDEDDKDTVDGKKPGMCQLDTNENAIASVNGEKLQSNPSEKGENRVLEERASLNIEDSSAENYDRFESGNRATATSSNVDGDVVVSEMEEKPGIMEVLEERVSNDGTLEENMAFSETESSKEACDKGTDLSKSITGGDRTSSESLQGSASSKPELISQDDTNQIKEGSALSKFSATTLKVLGYIGKSTRQISRSLSLPLQKAGKKEDKGNIKIESATKPAESDGSPAAESSDLQLNKSSENVALEEKPATESCPGVDVEVASDANAISSQLSPQVLHGEKGDGEKNEVEEKDICFYDIEDALDGFDIDICDGNINISDEEKLLLSDDDDILMTDKKPGNNDVNDVEAAKRNSLAVKTALDKEAMELEGYVAEEKPTKVCQQDSHYVLTVKSGLSSQQNDVLMEGEGKNDEMNTGKVAVDQKKRASKAAESIPNEASIKNETRDTTLVGVSTVSVGTTESGFAESVNKSLSTTSQRLPSLADPVSTTNVCGKQSLSPTAKSTATSTPIANKTTSSIPKKSPPCSSRKPSIVSSPGVKATTSRVNTSQVVTPTKTSPSLTESKSPTLSETKGKPKLPCFPNPPSLDMKSPFFKPKASFTTKSTTVVTVTTSSPVAKSVANPTIVSSSKVISPNVKAHLGPDADEKSPVKLDGTETRKKGSVKKRKIKKDGKKVAKKSKTVKPGESKQKGEKESKKAKDKSGKKKVKKKKKAEPTTEKAVIEKSNVPQTIETIAGTDRPKNKPQHTDQLNRNRKFPNQTNTQTRPPMPAVYFNQTQQYQQPVIGSQYLSNYVMPNAQTQIVPQNVAMQPFQYGQQMYAPQVNQLAYTPQYTPSAVSPLYPAQRPATGFQPTYYVDQTMASQTNNVNNELSLTNVGQSKEYAHLAWL
ncbi:uncharacterized protein LOC135696061 [Rhopilema esculentum]|uniref:uncharacterized protein LOC135696061 n=1 Tax=Rhopilema esculentum TaxID=499914 RepID=UPI0031E2C2F8|eukprot:gene12229-2862_t